MIEGQPIISKLFYIWRDSKLVAVKAQVVNRVVFGNDEDKIGPFGRFRRVGQIGNRTNYNETVDQSK